MNEELSVWSLIKNDQFEKACDKADLEYKSTGDILTLRNKLYALFHLKKYANVISLCKQLIEFRKGETDTDFLSLGVAEWMLADTENAIEAWKGAQHSLYKDAAGGVETQIFLYFAAVKTNQQKLKSATIKAIKKLLKSKRSMNWPGPIGHYLIDEISESNLISNITSIPILKERQLCQAYFALALKRLEKNELDDYYENLKKSISYGSSSYLELTYYLAKGELGSR